MNRDFKGIWIPKKIWLSKELKLMEKLFLVEIDSLDNENSCFASNKYFSEFFGISKGRCTQIIKSLESKGFVIIKLETKGKQVVKRIIRVVNKLSTPSENIKQGYLENDDVNNTIVNNTNISKDITEETSDEDEIEKKEYIKKEITKNIDELIKEIKELLSDYGYLYDNTQERNFARHIFTAKQFGETADNLKYSRKDFAIKVVRNSLKMYFRAGKVIGPKSIYKMYPKVINDWKKPTVAIQKKEIVEVSREHVQAQLRENGKLKNIPGGRFGEAFKNVPQEEKSTKSRFYN